jgi:16S rRNA (cytosine967-C5)-methyltransferase
VNDGRRTNAEGPSRSVRSLALGILIRVARDGAHAAPLLDARGAALPARDRDLLRALVKTTLRNALRLDHVLARAVDAPLERLEPSVLAALRLGAAQLLLMDRIPPHAAVAETVAATKHAAPRAAGLVNAVLRRVSAREAKGGRIQLPRGAGAAARLALETSHPEWLVARWIAAYGEEAASAALHADQADSPVDLLADPRAGTLEEVRARLAADGVVAEPSPFAPLALTVVSGDAAGHELVRTGKLAVVDAAAQGTVELVRAAPLVADLAAAPGGKTRTLLARGLARRVVAVEKNATRATRLARALAASGRRDEVEVVRADSGALPLSRASLESILLDAPCSGTGTLRKNPEIRLRLSLRDLAVFAAGQRRLLAAALAALAPGGRLVYVTCSLEREENDGVVDTVLADRGGAVRVVPDEASLPPALAAALGEDGAVRVLPGATNDGFTVITIEDRRQVRSPSGFTRRHR